jgi:hypothetical protein
MNATWNIFKWHFSLIPMSTNQFIEFVNSNSMNLKTYQLPNSTAITLSVDLLNFVT